MTRSLLLALALTVTSSSTAAASPLGEPLAVPAARVGDRWKVAFGEAAWELTVEGRSPASDRWGRHLDAFAISVEGFHPVASESKQVTRHVMYVDPTSGTQVADVAEYVFGGTGGVSSDPAAYSVYEPNDPDGWPGWVAAGGALAGRVLTPGETVEVPFVMTNSRGASSIRLGIEEAPANDGERCVLASGTTPFPLYTYWGTDGYQRSSLSVGLELTQCAGSPYASHTRITYSGTFEHSVEFTIEHLDGGDGEAIGAGPYEEPTHHVAAPPVSFGGSLLDGGQNELPSIEAAQDAAALSPGLLAWRLAHPDGYLVEAELLTAELQRLPEGTDRWRLVYAEPSGAAHEVQVTTGSPVPIPVDVPRPNGYPSAVPHLTAWPGQVASLAGALGAWRTVAGPDARLVGVRWQPLLDENWYMTGGVNILCDGAGCGDLYGEIAVDVRTAALGTGEHPIT